MNSRRKRRTARRCIGTGVIAALAGLMILTLASVWSPAAANDHIIYVDASASGGADDGSSWGDAYDELHKALDAASDGDEIWVAQGTYLPDDSTEARNGTFSIPHGVSLYGGFAGGESDRESRDPESNTTTLSGDIGTENDSTDNVYTVVTVGDDDEVTIDGVTISGGNANADSSLGDQWDPVRSGGGIYSAGNLSLTSSEVSGNHAVDHGGGIFNDAGALTLTSSEVRENQADEDGGGMYNDDGSVILTNTEVHENQAGDEGGGISNNDGQVMLENSHVRGNETDRGGGIHNLRSTLTLINSSINDNEANVGGGILSLLGSSTLNLVNSTVSGNQAAEEVGGIRNSDGTVTLTNSVVSGNRANEEVGGIRNSDGTVTLTNSVVSGNQADDVAGGIRNDAGTLSLINSVVWGNQDGDIDESGSSPTTTVNHAIIGTGNVDCQASDNCFSDNPLFVDWIDPEPGDWEPTSDGNYRLLRGSPAIDAGYNQSYDAAINSLPQDVQDLIDPNEDLDGNSRFVLVPDGPIDLGAYEWQLTDPRLTLTVDPQQISPGEEITVTVSVSADNADPDFAEGSVVTLSGHSGGPVDLTLDAQSQVTTTLTPDSVGVRTLTATLGTLADSQAVVVSPQGERRDQDTGTGNEGENDVEPDITPPEFSNVPADITAETDSPAGTTVDYTPPIATDDVDGDVTISCEPAPSSVFTVGDTTVECTATDTAGNTSTVSFSVTVIQTTQDPPPWPGFTPDEELSEPFWAVWARTDLPVRNSDTSRTWMWGPGPFTGVVQEEYDGDQVSAQELDLLADEEIPDGARQVVYFDKTRMELTHPEGDPNDLWYVTNGLLVVELITGQRQVGDDAFVAYAPADINVAGDRDDPDGPTYASFTGLLDEPAQSVGTPLTERVDRNGTVTDAPGYGDYGVTVDHVDGVTQHGIAAPFWDFMNSTGTVYEDGALLEDLLFEHPVYATGRPITEAYWTTVAVGGESRDVLVQCFERRCLTYTPDNPVGWEVEAGNVGQHYYYWRYMLAPEG